MIPWSQDYRCATCARVFNKIVEKAERLSPQPCESKECDGVAGPIFTPPKISRASYPDGTKRPGFAEGREAAELEAASFDLPPAERGPLNDEISRIRKSRTE